MKETQENISLIKQPSAWIPLVISLVALAEIVVYVVSFGISQNKGNDEGAPARIFQLLMVGQIPFILYFAFKWLPKKPTQALFILAIQATAWLTPVILMIFLESL